MGRSAVIDEVELGGGAAKICVLKHCSQLTRGALQILIKNCLNKNGTLKLLSLLYWKECAVFWEGDVAAQIAVSFLPHFALVR